MNVVWAWEDSQVMKLATKRNSCYWLWGNGTRNPFD